MKFKRRAGIETQVSMVSMADIVFLLLIFFIVSTTFVVQPAIKVKLPEASTREIEPAEAITVFLGQQGELFLNEKRIEWRDLESNLRQSLIVSSQKLVVIKADKNVILNRVVRVMDLARLAGAQKLALATTSQIKE